MYTKDRDSVGTDETMTNSEFCCTRFW